MNRTQTLREANYCLADGLKDILDAYNLLRENDTDKDNDSWINIRQAVISAEDAIVKASIFINTDLTLEIYDTKKKTSTTDF